MKAPVLVLTAISVLVLAISMVEIMPKKLAYNGSASAPIGFYWLDQSEVKIGDYVLITPPQWLRTLIEDRNYLLKGIPLIKRIVAAKGDAVCRWKTRVFINGVIAAHAKSTDSNGRQLPRWQGCRQLQDHQIFLLQKHPNSFDSRYFGPVEEAQILGRATRISLFSRD